MGERVRLQKAIARAGLMSRRNAEQAIAAGRVVIEGETAVLGDRVDVGSETVTLDGAPLPLNPDLTTYLVYKPTGVLSTAHDPQGRPTVVDLVPANSRLFPVGRLDADSEGLLLLTNDGELANRVAHPRYEITKKYVAVVDGRVGKTDVRRLTAGIVLDDGPARALAGRILEQDRTSTIVELVMGEGRNREVRRMFEALGFTVTSLVRTAIGPISDRALKPGQSRRLTAAEVHRLLGAAKDP
jgi:23S rRNA pseudouridine2605 synthase